MKKGWLKFIAGCVLGVSNSIVMLAAPDPAGWYAGDIHVHRSCGGAPESIESIYSYMVGQDLNVVSLLADMGNGEVQNPVTDLPKVNGVDDPISTTNRIVRWDAEWHWDATYAQYPHQALGGHVLALGLTNAMQIWNESASTIFDWAHQQGGIAGFAHFQYLNDNIPTNLTCCAPIEYPVEMVLGTCDFISEDVNGGDSFLRAYYRLLNCGFRPGFAAGSDHPCAANVGATITYAQIGAGGLTYSNWLQSIKSGRTVVSRNGRNEFLDLKVNGTNGPGDEVRLTGAGNVQVSLQWTVKQNLTGRLELVRDGVVIASQTVTASPEASITLNANVSFTKSGWLTARRMDDGGHRAHTAAVFVTVDNAPVRASVADAQFYVQWIDTLLTNTASGGVWASYYSATNRPTVHARYQAAKNIFQLIAAQAATNHPPVISTTQMPSGFQNSAYTFSVIGSGGLPPYTWSLVDGDLPEGLTLNTNTGAITGMPLSLGSSNFTLQVSDSVNPPQIATQALSISIIEPSPSGRFGNSSNGFSQDSLWHEGAYINATRFQADSNMTVRAIWAKVGAITGRYKCALYTDNEGAAYQLLSSTLEVTNPIAGWQSFSLVAPQALINSNYYWLAIWSDASNASVYYSGGDRTTRWRQQSYGAWPDLINLDGGGANLNYCIYATGATLTNILIQPAAVTISAGTVQQFAAIGNYSDGSANDITSQATWVSSDSAVAVVNIGAAFGASVGVADISAALGGMTNNATLTVTPAPLCIGTNSLPRGIANSAYTTSILASGGTAPYNWSIASGALPPGMALNYADGNILGMPTASGTFNFVVQVQDADSTPHTTTQSFSLTIAPPPPILILTNAANPFTAYYSEILSIEGLNSYTMSDISTIGSGVLTNYEVLVLGEMTLNASQVTIISNWVSDGGNLVAFRPDKKLAPLLGLEDVASTLVEGYLRVDTTNGPGVGIVAQTMQYHGAADRYALAGAASLAALYSTASMATTNPAVTVRNVGANGGQAAAFTYDLARSVVYTRQGNPAWINDERDGFEPLRSSDLFYGNKVGDVQPDWVDRDKIAIPQADEQQRLLVNLIISMNAERNLLPRFWYFPNDHKAVIVMTGDDHANNGTAGRFDHYLAVSGTNTLVDDWKTVRGTAYLFPNTPLTDAAAAAYHAAGFEIGLHCNSGCANYTSGELAAFFSQQLQQWAVNFPSLPAPVTHRMHCIAWSGYTMLPEVERQFGMRLDTSYYYWPESWVSDTPGLFTGSGMPMRFATTNGNTIDVFQAVTQMTDESGQDYPYTADVILDKALGPEGYYGFFVANMHLDSNAADYLGKSGSDAIIATALQRGVPVITSRQLLTWLDGRNNSLIEPLNLQSNKQTIAISVDPAARGLQAMQPVPLGHMVTEVKSNGVSVAYAEKMVKGIVYAVFPAATGNYEISFAPDNIPPQVSGVSPANNATNASLVAPITILFNEPLNAASVNTSTIKLLNDANSEVSVVVSYNPATFVAVLTPLNPLTVAATYTVNVLADGVTDLMGNAFETNYASSFTTVRQLPVSIWADTTLPAILSTEDPDAVELGMKFRSAVAGHVTGIRFYKGADNVGPHIGNLWKANGDLLASVLFENESVSGWQQQLFAVPVAIESNTTYVVSYHAPQGGYSTTGNYFSGAGVTNYPLRALADGEEGGNGLYAYGPSSFPNGSYNANNYWVDVKFAANKTLAPIILGDLAQGYSGGARSVSAVTAPAGLNVNLTYNGSSSAPTNAGSYEVIAAISELNYVGGATNTLVIFEPNVVLSINSLGADTVVLSWNSIPGSTYRVQYKNDLNDLDWLELLPHITATTTNSSLTNYVGGQPQRFYRIRTLAHNPAVATVTLSDLNQPYSGTARQVSAITAPAGLNVQVTYNGSINAPTNAGTYEVIAAIVEPNFVGGTTNTLVVLPPPPMILTITKLNPVNAIPAQNSASAAANVLVSWNSVSNLTYRLQYKDSLTATEWIDKTPDIQANGAATSATDSVPAEQMQRFYRVRLVP